jgi:histone H3/H4
MNGQLTAHSHIEITETLVRLYVFLAQDLDRCLNEAARRTYPEQDLQSHLASTRAEIMEMLSVNRVVKEKVEQECHRVLSLAAACLADGAGKTGAMEELKAERAVLKTKTMALSDLLAVFRAA